MFKLQVGKPTKKTKAGGGGGAASQTNCFSSGTATDSRVHYCRAVGELAGADDDDDETTQTEKVARAAKSRWTC